MKKFCLMTIVTAAIVLSTCSVSRAAVILDYIALPSDAGSANPVVPGSSIKYDIFLRETLTLGSTELINANGGLIGAGFYVNVISGSGTTITAVDFDPAFGAQPGGGVGGAQRNFTPTQARLSENGLVNVQLTQVSATEYRAKLGTLTLSANSDTTTFALSPYRNAPTGSFGGSGTDGITLFGPPDLSVFYDADVTNNAGGDPGLTYTGANSVPATQFSVSVAAIPEPSSMILGGALVIGGFGAYRRRRQATAAAKT